jgi:hypothetical protein
VDIQTRKDYAQALAEELTGAIEFIKIIQKCRIPELFARDCGAKFSVQYISAGEFAKMLCMTPKRMEYLKRYF